MSRRAKMLLKLNLVLPFLSICFASDYVHATNYHDPADPIYTPVRDDGARCRKLTTSTESNKCGEHNKKMIGKCAGVDVRSAMILGLKNLVAGCQFSNDRLEFAYTCICECFHPDTCISAVEKESGLAGYYDVRSIVENQAEFSIFATTKNSTLSQLEFTPKEIKRTTFGREDFPLVAISPENGTKLKLTTEHGVVTAFGTMITAQDVHVGDALATVTGSPIRVSSISTEAYSGYVYNLEIDSKFISEHILDAEGILVGDLVWQNQLAGNLGEILIRQ